MYKEPGGGWNMNDNEDINKLKEVVKESSDFYDVLSGEELEDLAIKNNLEEQMDEELAYMAVDYTNSCKLLREWINDHDREYMDLIRKHILYVISPYKGEQRHELLEKAIEQLRIISDDSPVSIQERLHLQNASMENLENYLINEIAKTLKQLFDDNEFVENLEQMIAQMDESKESDLNEEEAAILTAMKMWLGNHNKVIPEAISDSLAAVHVNGELEEDFETEENSRLKMAAMVIIGIGAAIIITGIACCVMSIPMSFIFVEVFGAGLTMNALKLAVSYSVKCSIPILTVGLGVSAAGILTKAVGFAAKLLSGSQTDLSRSVQSENAADNYVSENIKNASENVELLLDDIRQCLDEMRTDIDNGDFYQAEILCENIEDLLEDAKKNTVGRNDIVNSSLKELENEKYELESLLEQEKNQTESIYE